jgi:general secretion pathway protein D
MSRLLPTAVVLALIVGCVPPSMTVLASPIVAQEADAPAGPTPPSTATPPGPPAARPRAIVLNFENADIETVTQAVSEIVGFSYVLAPDVRGKVTVQTAGAIRREDVFPVFLSILEVHGFTAVKTGAIYKIVRTETVRERAIPTFTDPPPRPTSPPDVGPPPGTTLPPDHPVTQVLAPRFASAATLATVVRPLVSGRGSIIAHPLANVLIVTDTAANVGKVAEIVERLDVELAAEEVHVIRLQYADASYVASILNHVFVVGRLARPPVIVPDRRTNSLVIRARPWDLETIGRLLGHD